MIERILLTLVDRFWSGGGILEDPIPRALNYGLEHFRSYLWMGERIFEGLCQSMILIVVSCSSQGITISLELNLLFALIPGS
jgi:hypothetical protein